MSSSVNHESISGNLNVTNTLSGYDLYTQIIETCKQIHSVLVDHCGPYATDALVIQDTDGRNLKDSHYAIFTKDGINIVRAIQFVSPIQKHIQNLVVYVGSRVDSRSHDGTTTAMLLFTALVILYFTKLNETLISSKVPNYRQLRSEFLETLKILSDGFEQSVVNIDRFSTDMGISRTDAIRYIAYHQAMLSSKGDRELSNAIVEVVETLPTELYGLFSVSQSKIETDKRFTVVKDDFDFVLTVVSNLDNMNHRMNTEYLAESCDLIVSEDDLVRGNPALLVVQSHVELAKQNLLTRDLVIITKSIDATLHGLISAYNKANKHQIVIFNISTHKPYSSRVTILSALAAVASVHSMQEHVIDPSLPYVIQNAKVHYKNSRLFVSNLYTKDASAYHPSFTDPTRFIPYTKMVADIREELEEFISGRRRIETAASSAMYEDYVEIYRRMISSDVRNLQISGMRHDTLADRDILQDAFGAVLSSLEHGFVFDGYLKLYLMLKYTSKQTASIRDATDIIYKILASVHKQDVVFTDPIDYNSSRFDDRLLTALSHSKFALVYLYYSVDNNPTDKIDITTPITDGTTSSVSPVIQPADSYRELFRRIEDLLPKLLNTSRAIIPNTINTGTQ